MSAADYIGVRTPAGYRSVPRRVGLGMIAAGRARLAGPADGADAPLTPADEPVAAVVPATPESAPTPQEHTQTPTPNPYDLGTFAAAAGELDADDSASSPDDAGDGSWHATRGPVVYDTADDVPTVEAVPLPAEPKPSARRGEWADYADSLGVEVTSSMTKREIQHAAQEAATSLANLPQPALTGGRLETPEDEPATETVADDQDPRTR